MNSPSTSTSGSRACCSEPKCGDGLRNNYFEGKRLTVHSFRVEQNYSLARRRLVNRAIHGWGVVYGYAIGPGPGGNGAPPGGLVIGAGLALDKCGRELLQEETAIQVADVIIVDKNGAPVNPATVHAAAGLLTRRPGAEESQCWLLSVHYAEQYTAPVTIDDPCRCERHEWDRTCETVRYSLKAIDRTGCCPELECELQCECGTGPCGEGSDEDTPRGAASANAGRGGYRCLCEYSMRTLPDVDCRALREIEEPCGRVWVDLQNGVPLACIDLERDDRGGWTFGGDVEACGPRRLVKRNDVLFDLIRGCDLTHISAIGWAPWHRSDELIPFAAFAAAFRSTAGGEVDENQAGFWVKFSRPVREYTLRRDCFAMTIKTTDSEGGWWRMLRVPIVDVYPIGCPDTTSTEGLVCGASIVVDGKWLRDAVTGPWTRFQDYETLVEFEVRGDFIVDCDGQTIDANARGLSPFPTGNGTPGGTFLSTFRVGPAKAAPSQ